MSYRENMKRERIEHDRQFEINKRNVINDRKYWNQSQY